MIEGPTQALPERPQEESVDSSFLNGNGRKKNIVLSFKPEALMETTQELGRLALDHVSDEISVKIKENSLWRRLLRRRPSELKVTYPAEPDPSSSETVAH